MVLQLATFGKMMKQHVFNMVPSPLKRLFFLSSKIYFLQLLINNFYLQKIFFLCVEKIVGSRKKLL